MIEFEFKIIKSMRESILHFFVKTKKVVKTNSVKITSSRLDGKKKYRRDWLSLDQEPKYSSKCFIVM